jgi:hypothetical protein
MALKVQQRPAPHIADIGDLVRPQVVGAGPEAVQVVEIGVDVVAGPLVPHLTVRTEQVPLGIRGTWRVLCDPCIFGSCTHANHPHGVLSSPSPDCDGDSAVATVPVATGVCAGESAAAAPPPDATTANTKQAIICAIRTRPAWDMVLTFRRGSAGGLRSADDEQTLGIPDIERLSPPLRFDIGATMPPSG